MDIYFLLFASFGVIVFGLSKGGFPGPISMLAVPIMSFAMSPLKAAGILLPLLLVMDVIALYLYWNRWDMKFKENILLKLPANFTLENLANLYEFLENNNVKKYAVIDYRIEDQIILPQKMN